MATLSAPASSTSQSAPAASTARRTLTRVSVPDFDLKLPDRIAGLPERGRASAGWSSS